MVKIKKLDKVITTNFFLKMKLSFILLLISK